MSTTWTPEHMRAYMRGKNAQRVEKVTGIRHVDDTLDETKLTPEGKAAVETLKRAEESFAETLNQFDTEFDNIYDFVARIREEEKFTGRYSEVLTEYANAIANKVSDKWLKTEIEKISKTVESSFDEGMKIRTSTVSGLSETKLPKVIGDVLSEAYYKVHPRRGSAFDQLFTSVNNQLRGMWAAGDFSFQLIQMLPTWFDNPKAAFQASKIGLETLKDPTVFSEYLRKFDEARYGTDAPTSSEWISGGTHIAHASGEGSDLGGIGGRVQSIPGYGGFLKKSNTVFTETGNANRMMLNDVLWNQYKSGGASMLTGLYSKAGKAITDSSTRKEVIEAISNASNRATGYSAKGFGGPYGSAIFFAPRFMQSQIEMVIKAAWGGGIESQVARRQLAKLIAVGTGITIAANEARRESTDFDPRSSNFMRIKNVGGADLSIFGPWDTLVKGF